MMKEIKTISLLFFLPVLLLSYSDNNVLTATKPVDSATKFDNSQDDTIKILAANTEDGVTAVTMQPAYDEGNASYLCTPPSRRILRTPLIPGEQDLWCWAACGEMVMESFKGSISQCEEANRLFDRVDCCLNPADCNQTGLPPFDDFDFVVDSIINQALSWEELKVQIGCAKRPFCMVWRYTDDPEATDTSGHMMVVSGYKRENGEDMVKILDPADDIRAEPAFIGYSYFVSGSDYEHWKDYYNIRRKIGGNH